MDEIDQMLIGAWRGMNKRLRMDRLMAARREARAFRVGLLRRPARACCLALRASDTRLAEDWNVLVDPAGGVECFDAHRVTIRGEAIRELVKPVYISHRDAMPASKACHLFGRSKEAIARWVKRGVFEVEYVPAMSQGMRGKPVPVVWTKSPMDPNAHEGESPDPMWGSAWQWLWKYVPLDDVQTMYRTPRFHSWRGQHVFRGWDWICPGRVIEADTFGDEDADASRGTVESDPQCDVAREPRRVVAGDAEEKRGADDAEAYPRRHVAARGRRNISDRDAVCESDADREVDSDRNADAAHGAAADCGADVSRDGDVLNGRRMPLVREWEMPSLRDLSRVHDVATGDGVVRYAGCGRRVRHLYSPVRAFSLLDYLDIRDEGKGDAASGLDLDDGTRPTIALPDLGNGEKRAAGSFACRDCWQPVFTDGVNPNETWNLFVTHMSGGLLTGHDVPRPRGVAERGRKHCFSTSRRDQQI